MNEIVSYSQRVFRNNYRYIIKLSAPFIILGGLSYFFSPPTNPPNSTKVIIGLCVYLIVISIYQCSLVLFLSQDYQNNIAPVMENLHDSIVYTPLLLISFIIIYSPFIIAASILFFLNSIPFIMIPMVIIGVYISLKSSFVPFHLILDGEKPLRAIRLSFSQTNGRLGKIIIILISFYAVSSIIDSLTSIDTKIEAIKVVLFFIGVAVTILLVAVQQTAVFKLYVDSCYDDKNG